MMNKIYRCLWMTLLTLLSVNLLAQEVTISGNQFVVNGDQIFFNGANTPWQYQSDGDISFIKKNFDVNWWNNEFENYVDNNINMCRVWVHGTGYYTPATDQYGNVSPYSSNDSFWSEMDALVNAAASKGIYLFITFWSFDMVKDNTSNYQRYRDLIVDDGKIDSYINNFLIPFVQRYQNNPFVFGYDICNEPEHMWRDANCGNISPYWVTRFLAKSAAAINQNTSKPVTIGSMWIIYNSPNYGSLDDPNNAGWNRYTASHLQQYYNSSDAYLDFYSPHWYSWQYEGGNATSGPFETTVNNWVGSDDKPVLIGETYGGDLSYISMASYYIQSYQNGYDGVCGWRNTNYNDGYGSWSGIISGTNAFHSAYPNLVYPGQSGGSGCSTTSLSGTIQAEDYCNMSGIQTETTSDSGGGLNVGWIDAGDWLSYKVDVPSAGTYTVQYRVASQSGGGSIQIEQGGGGIAYGNISVPSTGGWQNWTTISHTINLSAGSQIIGIAFPAGGFNLNWISIAASAQNITYNKDVYTSSNESSSHLGSNVVDANGTTRWSSLHSDSQWITIDLGASYNINRVKIDWEAAYANKYQIQVSNDNSSWATVHQNESGDGGTDDISLSTNGRYIKMYAWERATQWGYSIYEFEVYGTLASSRIAEADISSSPESNITVSPNPVDDGFFKIELLSSEDSLVNVEILDIQGKLLYKSDFLRPQIKIDTHNLLDKGLYILRVNQGSKHFTQKLIIH